MCIPDVFLFVNIEQGFKSCLAVYTLFAVLCNLYRYTPWAMISEQWTAEVISSRMVPLK